MNPPARLNGRSRGSSARGKAIRSLKVAAGAAAELCRGPPRPGASEAPEPD
jgi:hypothetical protein